MESLKITLRTMILADWAPSIRQAVGLVATAMAMAYALGYVSGKFIHQANDRLARATTKPTPFVVKHQQLPEISEPCAETSAPEGCALSTRQFARVLVSQGMSKRMAARTLGVHERTVRRYLQEAA